MFLFCSLCLHNFLNESVYYLHTFIVYTHIKMSNSLKIENVLIQIRSLLNADKIKLWLMPYYDEQLGACEVELEVRYLLQTHSIPTSIKVF